MTQIDEVEKRDVIIREFEQFVQEYSVSYTDYGEEVLKAVLNLLHEQQPRVMTLEEVVQHYSLPPVFVDDLGAQEDYYEDIQPLYFEFPQKNGESWIVHWRGYAKAKHYLYMCQATYNEKWRCWTSRPTDEQKKVTPWETGTANGEK